MKKQNPAKPAIPERKSAKPRAAAASRTRPTAASSSSVKAKPAEKPSAKPAELKIPYILLEGDAPAAPTTAPGGPGQRYSLGPPRPGRTFPRRRANCRKPTAPSNYS